MIRCERGGCRSRATAHVETTEPDHYFYCDGHFDQFQDRVLVTNRTDPDNMIDYSFTEVTERDHEEQGAYMLAELRDWRTTYEVAAMEKVRQQTVRWWIQTGKLQGVLAGPNTYLIHDSAIERFRARRHNRDTPSAIRGGEASSQRPVRRPIDPAKRYRYKGEIVTGAELLRRRAEA